MGINVYYEVIEFGVYNIQQVVLGTYNIICREKKILLLATVNTEI